MSVWSFIGTVYIDKKINNIIDIYYVDQIHHNNMVSFIHTLSIVMWNTPVNGQLKINGHTYVDCWYSLLLIVLTSICDWIWDKKASMHNYKYFEVPILIIWCPVFWNEKQMLASNLSWFYTHS